MSKFFIKMKKVLFSIALMVAICTTSSAVAQEVKKEACSKKTECVKTCNKAEEKKCDKAEEKKCDKSEEKKCCKSDEKKCTKDAAKKCCKEKQSAEN